LLDNKCIELSISFQKISDWLIAVLQANLFSLNCFQIDLVNLQSLTFKLQATLSRIIRLIGGEHLSSFREKHQIILASQSNGLKPLQA
jgi:hypothetical protein